MPELPDVQVFRQYLDATSLHRPVETTRVRDESLLRDVTARALVRRLERRALEETRRHGKHLFVRAGDAGWLRLHFGMTGELDFRKSTDDLPDSTALVLEFADGSRLAYLNTRRLGEIGWTDDVDGWIGERGLGPDALGVDLRTFRGILEGRSGTVKGALMDQSSIAGIGNVYADEILFQAGTHPATLVADLDDEAVKVIHRQAKRVLERAIEKTEVVGRPTYVCPDHQPPPG